MIKQLSRSKWQTVGVVMAIQMLAMTMQARAEEDTGGPKIRGKVIGRIWHTKVNGGLFFSYTRKLAEELELPSSPIMMMMGGPGAMGAGLMNSIGQPPSEEEGLSKGTLLFLESAPQSGHGQRIL